MQRLVGPDGADTVPSVPETFTVVEAVEVELLQPLATTVTVAVPENDELQVTTPVEEIVPAATGEILQV
jgi:hypothetical protein